MTDEELYQQAADELDSDARRPRLWARACALASDDHDEARYLYTNLRVDELVAARKGAPHDPEPHPATGDPDGMELSLAPLDDDADEPVLDEPAWTRPDRDGPAGSPFDDDALTDGGVVAVPNGVPGSAPTPADPHDDTLDRTMDDSLDNSLDDSLQHALDVTGERSLHASDSPEPLPTEPFPALTEAADDERDASMDEVPTDPPFDATLIDEPHWLDDEVDLERAVPDEDGASEAVDAPHDPFDGNGDRDDHGDHGDHDDDDDLETPIDWRSDPVGTRLPDAGAHEQASALGREPMARSRDPGVPSGAAAGVGEAYAEDEDPIVDLDGRGPVWALYESGDGTLQAVKRGVSWGAVLLTFPWLLWRGLFGTALVYALLWVVSLGGLLTCLLAWSDAGAAAPPLLRGVCAGFALIALLGLVVVPFLRANRWREAAWQRRGRVMRGEVRALGAAQAKRRVIDA